MKRKYFFEETFFEKIDSKDKAYILGFIFADGFVAKNESFLRIEIHKKDISILNNFCEFINFDKKKSKII